MIQQLTEDRYAVIGGRAIYFTKAATTQLERMRVAPYEIRQVFLRTENTSPDPAAPARVIMSAGRISLSVVVQKDRTVVCKAKFVGTAEGDDTPHTYTTFQVGSRNVRFTTHALRRVHDRLIDFGDVCKAITEPDRVRPHATRPNQTLREHGNVVIAVEEMADGAMEVVTVMLRDLHGPGWTEAAELERLGVPVPVVSTPAKRTPARGEALADLRPNAQAARW